MADTKITALTALTGADPANDVIPIVDVSDTTMAASGTTKKISVNNILGASGTATLASATITGDLTVDTNVLKVDSANNRVGIGTASPSYTFQIGTNDLIASSIGLGVGTNPAYKLHIKNDLSELYFRDNGTSSELLINSEAGARSALYFGDTVDTVRGGIVYDSTTDALEIRGYNNATRVTINSSGNLGLGTTSFGASSQGVLAIANAVAVPTGNPTGGGVLYVEAGALKYRGSSGTITTIANA